MEFEEMVRQFVRMPWEVWKGQENFKDNEISQDLVHSAHAGDYFKQEPKDEDRPTVIKAIAEVMVIALTKQSGDCLEERNKFKALPEAQKEKLRNYLGIDKCHANILRISSDNAMTPMLVSYVAAAYAFTTWTKPYVIDFDLLSAVAEQAKTERCQEETNMRCAGLLIIKGLDLPSYSNIDTYSFLLKLLNMREQHQRINMFFHTPFGKLQNLYFKNLVPNRTDVIDAYLEVIPHKYLIHNSFVGKNVHICEVDKVDMIIKSKEQQKQVEVENEHDRNTPVV